MRDTAEKILFACLMLAMPVAYVLRYFHLI